MSVLLEAIDRAEDRKTALVAEGDENEETLSMPFQALLLFLSGADLDPSELHTYMEAIVTAYLCDVAMKKHIDVIFRGILTEGLVTGMMIERVAREQALDTDAEPIAHPTITGTAKTLAGLLLVRAQQVWAGR